MVRSCRAVVGAVVGLLLAACSGGEPVLHVDLRTDYVPGAEFFLVRAELVRPAETPGGFEHSQSASRDASFGDDFVAGRRVAEFPLLEPGAYLVRVSLHDAAGAVVATRSARVTVRETYGLTLVITRSCGGVTCPGPGDPPEATTCLGGRCVSEECSPLTPEACGTAECAADAECTSRVECATGLCSEGYCLQVPIDGACATGEWCSVERGCVPLPMAMPDGGTEPCVPEAEVCNGRDDDCDDSTDEGFDLATDPMNCSSCGTVCSSARATSTCEAGVCELRCDDGFADCDGDPSTGCEANLGSATRCGTCGTTCSGATPLCVLEGAAYLCVAECPASAPTLCGSSCVDTAVSPAHCGGCDTPCDPANATGACASGVCTIASCNTGFGDCDGGAANGCETDLSLPTSCGACGTTCGASTPYCVGSGPSASCANGCSDGVRGGSETDVDCGGPLCSDCGVGRMCATRDDCAGTLDCRGGTCESCGECEPGTMQSEPCGLCGMRTRTCQSSCAWGSWSACSGEGVCTPTATDDRTCGNCGLQSRICTSACAWSGWSTCTGEGVCSPSTMQSTSCGNCGTQSRTCQSSCNWGGYGTCTGEGECSPGTTSGSGCANSCQRRTCSAACAYPSACTSCACSALTQCGIGCPAAYHPTSYSRSSACGSGTTDNQSRCEPDCGSAWTKCGIGCSTGYHPTSYSRSSACGSGTTDNQSRCEQTTGTAFTKCGIGCPSGYHPVSYSRSSACGSGTTDNQSRCEINAGTAFTSCGLSCPSGYHPVSYSRSSACGSGTSDNQVRCERD